MLRHLAQLQAGALSQSCARGFIHLDWVLPACAAGGERSGGLSLRSIGSTAAGCASDEVSQPGPSASTNVPRVSFAASSEYAVRPAAAPRINRVLPNFTNTPSVPLPDRLPDGSQPPWTPTGHLKKRKVYKKRMGHMLNVLNDEYRGLMSKGKEAFPDIKPGDILRVDLVVPENDMRTAKWEGICMGIFRKGPMTSFTVRNVVKGAGPIERDFMLYSPFVTGITVLGHRKVRRAKLTYLRERRLSESTF